MYCRSLGFTMPSEHRQMPIEKPPANAGGTATTAVGNTTVSDFFFLIFFKKRQWIVELQTIVIFCR